MVRIVGDLVNLVAVLIITGMAALHAVDLLIQSRFQFGIRIFHCINILICTPVSRAGNRRRRPALDRCAAARQREAIMTKNKPAAATMPKIPLLFLITAEATLLALEAMVCVAFAVPAAVFSPFSLPGMLSDTGVSARTSAGFPFSPALPLSHRLPELSHTKAGFSPFPWNRLPAGRHFSCAVHGLSGAWRTGGHFLPSAPPGVSPPTAAFSCSASWAFP